MRFLRYCCWLPFIWIVSACALPASALPQGNTVLIDPGHGDFDGGASAPDGTLEKNLNLDISLQLRDMLTLCGVSVVMTRDSDVSISSVGDASIREKKISDMQNRLHLYNQASLVIAIHQNNFQSSAYSGTQVFYSANHTNSKCLAAHLQNTVVRLVQPQNTRQIKKATDGIYLLHHTTAPAVLVECGFLSNPQELSQLKSAGYRQKMAWAIALGYWNYIMET